MKIVTILGARPQFIKSVPVSRELASKGISEIIIHTGQHYDNEMNNIFFDELTIPKPHYFLNINNLSHGAMTGRMIEKIESILIKEKPDLVLVFGDTNSTLSGAVAASKLNIKIAHIEAGLRSYNAKMPEEINRIVADRLSSYLFCPTKAAVKNLETEGFANFNCSIFNSGDVMQDAAIMFSRYSRSPKINLPKEFILCTIHRQENTDDQVNLRFIIEALNFISKDIQIIFPLHPRTHKKIIEYKLEYKINENIKIIEPVGYLEMIYLLKNCSSVITDSGGLQKEAFFFQKLCLTVRNETEWVELVENGFNITCGSDYSSILEKYNRLKNLSPDFNINLYGNGNASKIIVGSLIK